MKLVDVLERVTAFIISRTLDENATKIIHRWRHVAPKIDKDLLLPIFVRRENSTISAMFQAVYLGGIDQMLRLVQESLPELGVGREDCREMSWIQSILYLNGLPKDSPEVLLNRKESNLRYNKAKSD